MFLWSAAVVFFLSFLLSVLTLTPLILNQRYVISDCVCVRARACMRVCAESWLFLFWESWTLGALAFSPPRAAALAGNQLLFTADRFSPKNPLGCWDK